MYQTSSLFVAYALDEQSRFFAGQLPADLMYSESQFEELWTMHPDEHHKIVMPGGPVKTPRWQQAFGADYHFTGNVIKAVPVPELLEPIMRWAKQDIDSRLNAILVNWYDGKQGHYIGKHRDSTKHMIEGASIVTISLGEERVLRLKPWKGKGFHDLPVSSGAVLVMPYDTNLHWTHEVPHFEKYQGRRISVTLRAFRAGVLEARQDDDLE